MRAPSRPLAIARPAPARARRVILLAAAIGATFVAAWPAQAQLGKLKKIGGDLVKDAGRDAAGLPSQEQSRATNQSSAEYAITPERLDLVLTALAPIVADAKREASARAVRKDYDLRMDKVKACTEGAAKRATSISEEYLAKGGEIGQRSAEVMQRYAAAMQAKQHLKAAYLQDTMTVLGYQTSMLMTGAKCGPVPYKPPALVASDAAEAEASARGGAIDESGRRVGNREMPESVRKSMSTYQFGMLRERIALWTLAQEDASLKLGAFTDAEKSALSARAADLTPLAGFFRDGMIRWTTWGDVKAW